MLKLWNSLKIYEIPEHNILFPKIVLLKKVVERADFSVAVVAHYCSWSDLSATNWLVILSATKSRGKKKCKKN